MGLRLYREEGFRSGVIFVFVVAAAAVSFLLAVVVGVDAVMNELIVGSDAVSLQQGINGSWGLWSNCVCVCICDRVHIPFLLAHPLLHVFNAGLNLCISSRRISRDCSG